MKNFSKPNWQLLISNNIVIGKGDLIGCDINKHLLAQSAAGMVPSGVSGLMGSAPTRGNLFSSHQRRPSIGTLGMSEVIVKSNADVRALTYCDLKVIRMFTFYQTFSTLIDNTGVITNKHILLYIF